MKYEKIKRYPARPRAVGHNYCADMAVSAGKGRRAERHKYVRKYNNPVAAADNAADQSAAEVERRQSF